MYQIIKPTPDDFDELTCLWEASVRATHHFIPEAYIQKLKPLVWSVYLHSMPLYMIRDNAGIEGFMGINGTMLEMLFVHPRRRRKKEIRLRGKSCCHAFGRSNKNYP